MLPMLNLVKTLVLFCALGLSTQALAAEKFWTVLPLGTSGGLAEGNMSCYLIAPKGSDKFIALDGGTVREGFYAAKKSGAFNKLALTDKKAALENPLSLIHAYLISHAHLDHIAGMIINSPEDTKKPILAQTNVINDLKDYIFNWRIFANFADQGTAPLLNKYEYWDMSHGRELPIPDTKMSVRIFPLSHVEHGASTAFLIHSDNHYALYLGDTGDDKPENSELLKQLWIEVAPLIKSKKLDGIFIESSYLNGRPDKLLFGHMTPSWLLHSLHELATITNPKDPKQSLKDLTIVVTHIKPDASLDGMKIVKEMKSQINALNDLGVKFVIPEQGNILEF
jgi:3',5'-cyclic-nucleotide phosphodiesterase